MNPAGIVLTATAEAAYVTAEEIRSHRRARVYSIPRGVAMVLLHDLYGYSMYRIAALMGGRHPETAWEAYRTTKRHLAAPGERADLYSRVVSRLPTP